MKLILVVWTLLLPSVYLVKMFNFNLEDRNVSLSRAVLDNVPAEQLPRQMTVCSSHLQGRVSRNTHTVFIIYQVRAESPQYQTPQILSRFLYFLIRTPTTRFPGCLWGSGRRESCGPT